ncbi:hypothetical protein BaRGS_00032901 [Batillaria attramentaria]|uniref:Uncharacterized protein n=1 Tax=Batillaria attramentaria TaxID=370345 RepID=A0ABD0JLU7_9CAEN
MVFPTKRTYVNSSQVTCHTGFFFSSLTQSLLIVCWLFEAQWVSDFPLGKEGGGGFRLVVRAAKSIQLATYAMSADAALMECICQSMVALYKVGC